MVTTTAPFTKTFATIVNDFTAAVQSASQVPPDFSEGSIFLSLAEGTAGVSDWLQKLYLFALSVERLATSFGSWVDTFTADYMPVVAETTSPRLPAVAATGSVTFSSATPQAQAVVPVGAVVATFDGSQTFSVYADPTNVNYSANIIPGGGYIRGAGIGSVIVPVQAADPGAAANVLANTITVIRTAMVGIDSVTNSAPFSNGAEAETDAALKARFQLFILSLRAATEGAIGYAITSLQQGLQCAIHKNVDPSGATDYGNVTIYIDDGSGNPPAALVSSAAAAVDAIRAAGVRTTVIAASTTTATVSMTIVTASGYNHTLLVAAVQNAIGAYINALGLEVTLPFTELAHVAYNQSPGVVNVTNVTLNGGTADLIPAAGKTIKAGTISVT